jgi:hypothetical protein
MFIRFCSGSWGWGRGLVVSRWSARARRSARMFVRFCFGSGCAGVSIAGLREIRAAHRVFLSPSHGTKALNECNRR